jgi:sigma-E factor negative regulatory protein RseB
VLQILLLILLTVTDLASAEESGEGAQAILQKMAKAMAYTNYQGTVVFLKNDKLETMKYFHTSEQNKQQERLVSLNSPLREIVRNSDEVRCHFKATQQVIVDHRPYEHSFIVDVPDSFEGLDSTYEFETMGEEDVAMLPAVMIAIKPKDEFRYDRRIWVAKNHFLPLKAVVYDANGKILEQVVFTELKVDKQLDEKQLAQTNSPNATADSVDHKKPNHTVLPVDAAFELTTLPQGFKKIFFTRKPLNKSEQPVDHLLLGDGFATVSVYMKENAPDPEAKPSPAEEIQTLGAVNSLSLTVSDSQITVLGEVPIPTIKFIAENIKLLAHPN